MKTLTHLMKHDVVLVFDENAHCLRVSIKPLLRHWRVLNVVGASLWFQSLDAAIAFCNRHEFSFATLQPILTTTGE